MKNLKFEVAGDEDYDIISGDIRIELSRGRDGWRLWNTVVMDQRFGGTQIIGPGPFRDWLEEQRALALATKKNPPGQ